MVFRGRVGTRDNARIRPCWPEFVKTVAQTGKATLRVGIRAHLPREHRVIGSMAAVNIDPAAIVGEHRSSPGCGRTVHAAAPPRPAWWPRSSGIPANSIRVLA